MKRVLTALVLIPLVLLLVFKAPLWAIAVVTCAVALLATHEYLQIVRGYKIEPYSALTYASVVLAFAAMYSPFLHGLSQGYLVPALLAPTAVVLFVAMLLCITAMRGQGFRFSLPSIATSLFAVPYIALSLAALIFIREQSVFWIVILFASVWAGDAAAMYVGKSLGKHKLAPRVSPNKTWEGAVGSVLGSVVACLCVLKFHASIAAQARQFNGSDVHPEAPGVITVIAAAILLNTAAQFGDLAESVIKRGAGVKDSGTLLPGHGGMLDRIDALLFAAPVLWYYLVITRS